VFREIAPFAQSRESIRGHSIQRISELLVGRRRRGWERAVNGLKRVATGQVGGNGSTGVRDYAPTARSVYTPSPTLAPKEWSSFLSGFLNRLLSVMLLLVGLPMGVAIAAAVLVVSGRPIVHKGWRLGRDRKRFVMYKFRTLRIGAGQVIGNRLLRRDDELTIPVIGWFLRDTRLDELPQLINILKGDMKFVGPRPVRPEVYEEQCRTIPGYDCRFAVKPGLIGYSQVFTPHNTPKRIRALLDARMMSRRLRPLSDLVLIIYTMLVVGMATFRRSARFVKRRMIRRYREKRRLTRVHPGRATAIVRLDGSDVRFFAPIVDIHDKSFVMVCGEPLDPLPTRFELVTWIGRNGHLRRVSAQCRGNVTQVRPNGTGYGYVVDFEPSTELGGYIVHQHFLKRSLAGAAT